MIKKNILRCAKTLPVVLPLLFVLFFFGYLSPCYDVTLHTENAVGKGNVWVSLSAPRSYDYCYTLYAPLDTENKTVIVKGVHYDVDAFALNFSSISELDLLDYEVQWLGIVLKHIDFKDILTPGEYGRFTLSPTKTGESVHLMVADPENDFTLKVKINFATTWMWTLYWILFIAIAVLLSVGLDFVLERFPALHFPLASLAGITSVLLAGCFFCNSIVDVEYTPILLNIFLLFGASLALGALTTPLVGTLAVMAGSLLFYIVNYFTILFRGRPVMPADFAAIGTAKEVLGGYQFTPTWKMIFGVIVCAAYVVYLVLIRKAQRKQEKKQSLKTNIIRRVVSAAAGIAVLVVCISNPFFASIDDSAWDNVALFNFHKNGMLLTFVKYARNASAKMPEGYSREIVDGYLEEFRNPSEATTPEGGIQPVNIIMVMNEAFSDLRTSGLNEQIDVMPYIDSLQQDTLEGSLYVSVIGGGTCNTEFEALTGSSLAFFSPGSYPYSQHIKRDLFSLASYFRDRGYITNAFHANEARNWNRDKVYPYLGFDNFYAIDDYPQMSEDDYLHSYLSDIANYRFVESVVSENQGKAQFAFNVTMQNHAGYEIWDDVEKAESVKEHGSDLERDAQVYLSLVKASDDAVKQLVETYKGAKEPTMIIFFGDHQPSLSFEAGMEIYGGVLQPLRLLHTRYFIWTNYVSDAGREFDISANYLPWLILKRGNFPLPPYVRMLEAVHEKYPVITSASVVDADGNAYSSVGELADDPLIQMYRYIQYANMFDELDQAWFEP